MRLPLLMMIIVLFVNLLVDTYIYLVLKRRFKILWPSRLQLWCAIALMALIVVTICLPRRNCSNGMLVTIMWCLYTYFAYYIPKYIFIIIDLIAKLPTLFKKHRLKWLSRTGVVISIATFLLLWWSALINRLAINVNEVDVEISDLPPSFDGFTIAQISDFHVGTYDVDTSYVAKVVDRVNSLNPDLIVFTGDIVNSKSSELDSQVSPLSRLKAPYGVISILGNHDYGDYSVWPSPAAKQANREHLDSLQEVMNWRLLKNETEILKRGNDSIAVIGVENIGDHPFPIYGSLTKAYSTLNDSVTKILLSHNPAHWVDSISDRSDVNIPLTLSGHTHAMQIELFGVSPALFRYKTWGGMYTDKSKNHNLYVNIGIGTVGIPARIGATPEITLITLKEE
ncbi:MAG: metallophosphoesterase [Muribaculum sp.]|nr:metallophosphoesterase [Muribaculum sp.]